MRTQSPKIRRVARQTIFASAKVEKTQLWQRKHTVCMPRARFNLRAVCITATSFVSPGDVREDKLRSSYNSNGVFKRKLWPTRGDWDCTQRVTILRVSLLSWFELEDRLIGEVCWPRRRFTLPTTGYPT